MPQNTHVVEFVASEPADRLDRVLAARVDLSRSRLKDLILAGEVAIDGQTIRDPARRVNPGASIRLRVPPPEPAVPEPQAMPLAVVYEDSELIVIDKPAGLVVHPASGNWTGTLVNALLAHAGESLSGVGGVKRPGIVHRLDKNTSGLLVVAKTDAAHRALAAQFADHGRTGPLERGYLAFVWGSPERLKGRIEAAINRHPHARDKMAVRRGGRAAVTRWEVVERYNDLRRKPVASLLACELETGRTHQVRVHLAHVGHPLLGDTKYGSGFKTKAELLPARARENLESLERHALHAHILGFEHPKTRAFLRFCSELPVELARLRDSLAENGTPSPPPGNG